MPDDPGVPGPWSTSEGEPSRGLAERSDRGRDIVPTIETQLENIARGLTGYLQSQGLPSESILVPLEERTTVLANLGTVLRRVPQERRGDSAYISKFVAAV